MTTTELEPKSISFPVQRERAALAGLESKLSDAMARRGKTIVEISRASAESVIVGGNRRDRDLARNALAPLNKQAKAIDAEIALLRIEISHARRMLEHAEAHAESGKAKAAADRGEPGRLVQLEISAPDGRVLRQWHKSADAARAALKPGYEVTGQVISGNIVSPIGTNALTTMESLLDAFGDQLLAWLASRGIVGSDKTIITLPSNSREGMQ